METKQSLEKFLKATNLCDHDHPAVNTKANELVKDISIPKEKAVSIFQFVRDKIKFSMTYFGESSKASNTLSLKFGDCGTKTNLQVALLRAVNIPARYHSVALRKDCIKGIVSPFYYRLIPELIPYHPWCECYLSEKWIVCDTLFDKPLFTVLRQKGIITKDDIPTIDWDGEADVNTMTKWIVKDNGVFSSLDELEKYIEEKEGKPKNYPKGLANFFTKRSNKYTNKLRKSS